MDFEWYLLQTRLHLLRTEANPPAIVSCGISVHSVVFSFLVGRLSLSDQIEIEPRPISSTLEILPRPVQNHSRPSNRSV
jgi:hypothetical protein